MNKRIIASLLALFVALSAGASVLAEKDEAEDPEVVEEADESVEAEDENEDTEDADEDEEDAEEAEEESEEKADEDLTVIAEPEAEDETEDEVEADDDKEEKTLILTLGENLIVTNGDSGSELDVAPCVIDGNVMIPFRAVFESLGAVISWDDETKTVFAVKDDSVIVLQIGQNVMYLNSDKIELDAPTVIVNDRTLISIDSVFKACGSNAVFNEEENTITITD